MTRQQDKKIAKQEVQYMAGVEFNNKENMSMSVTERMTETRICKEVRGITENSHCRLCK